MIFTVEAERRNSEGFFNPSAILLRACRDRAHLGGKVATSRKTLAVGVGGQGSLNVNSWAPDSMRFAYVTYEALP
jgi:hypothetical protein